MTPAPQAHIPVLLNEVLAALAPIDGDIHVDGTFGAGGYSKAILSAAQCRVIAIDRDPTAVARGRELAKSTPERFAITEGCYGDMTALLEAMGIASVNGVTLDIGVSSMQIDDSERGFSFAKDGPLDMRMGASGASCADLVNSASEEELADIVYLYGEERLARRVARAIVMARKTEPFSRTAALAEVVRRVVPRSKNGIDPATRTFQALRIAVNDELGELERGLAAAEHLLAPGGRLAVVTFHSLEDRIVKDFIRARSGDIAGGSRHLPVSMDQPSPPSFKALSKKPINASEAEISANPRARSARLRAAIRTSAPAFPALKGERR